MTLPRTVASILRDHVTLEVEGIDRMYLNAVVPILQSERGIAWFFRECRGHLFASSALMAPMTRAFVDSLERFAQRENLDVVTFEKKQRKDEVAAEYRARFRGTEGLLFVGKAQEKAPVFQDRASKEPADRGLLRLCINGHEYLKRQLERRGIKYEALDNGILSCEDPATLQKICDELSPAHIDALFRKWLRRLPHPFASKDRAWGIRYVLFLTRSYDRLLRPGLAVVLPDQAVAASTLRASFRQLEAAMTSWAEQAKLAS